LVQKETLEAEGREGAGALELPLLFEAQRGEQDGAQSLRSLLNLCLFPYWPGLA